MMYARRKADADALRDVAAEWAIRIDVNDLTDADNARLDAWLAENPAHAPALQRALLLWSDLDAAATVAKRRRQAHGRGDMQRKRGKSPRRRVLAAAAAVAAAFVLVSGVAMRDEIGYHLQADVYTGTGENRTLALAGGGTLKLDARTAIAFRDDAGHRGVELLTGRVQVEVGHEDPRPFHLLVRGAEIVDTGTVFQVDARDKDTEVSVSQGGVSVNASGRKVDAGAGESLLVDADGMPGHAVTADVYTLTAWTRGRLVFEDIPLAEVVAEIQRYYPGRIVLLDTGAGQRRVSGVFDATRPMDALHVIERNLHLRLKRWPGDIVTLDA